MSDDETIETYDETDGTDETPRVSRRRALATLGAGAGLVAGIGAFPSSAAAWKRNDVEFKGCSEVWIIVAPEDLDPETYTPPTAAHVIVETTDGDLDCRLQEFTTETTTTVPGRYGDAPVLKYAPPSGEKVLAVIIYNYPDPEDDRFSRESPLRMNPNRCANTPGTPDPRDADCASNTYDQDADILDGNNGVNGGGGANGRRARSDDDSDDDNDDHERGRGSGKKAKRGKKKGKRE